LDYTLRNITLYMKRLEAKPSTTGYSLSTSATTAPKEVSPFESMKAIIRNNLKGLKKEEDKDSGEGSGLGGLGSSTSVVNSNSVIGSTTGAGSNTSRRVSYFLLTFSALRYYSTLQLWRRHQKDRPNL
jgi:hypothetical protein